MKQMRIINVEGGYSQGERAGFKKFVYSNIITNTIKLLQGLQTSDIQLDPANKVKISKFL
jgi:hypothetical protein